MFIAPFSVRFCFLALIIINAGVFCKKSFPARLHHCAADFPQTHFRNVAGGDAQGVDGVAGVEIVDVRKILRLEIVVRGKAQPRQEHIGNAALQRPAVEHLDIELVELLQQTVGAAVLQVAQVIRQIVRHGVVAGGQHRFGQRTLVGQCAEVVLQCLDDAARIGFVHRPDGQRTGALCLMGVRHIEVVFEPPFAAGLIEYRDTGSTLVNPAAKLPVPAVQLQHGGGVGTLGIDQDLLVEGAFVVVTGRAEKSRPPFAAPGDAQ